MAPVPEEPTPPEAKAEDAPAWPGVETKGAARVGPDYEPPDWGGKPAIEGEVAVELIVRGEVRKRFVLDVEQYDSFLFGRGKNCDVNLEGIELKASRFHCVLQCKAGSPELFLYDLKSSHGTILNGRRLDPFKFEPVRIGGQIRFNADKPGPADCIAVLCGPEEAMGEEEEIDLTAWREASAKEREEMEKDLQRRKEAKRQRMQKEAKGKAMAKAFAAKAQQHAKLLKEMEEKSREKIHEVSWGMCDDAVEISQELPEEAQKLMDSSGQLDLQKVRDLTLTEKQELMVTKAEQKYRKMQNLIREKHRLEEKGAKHLQRMADAERDIDEMPAHRMGGGVSAEHLQKIEEKIEKAQEDFNEHADNILLSLGFKKAGQPGKISKKRAAMYDTHWAGEDDDDGYFDRTKVGGAVSSKAKVEEDPDVATELIGLPSLDGVQTKESLEVKLGQLRVEKARLLAQMVTEKAKERQRAAAAQDAEDSLDAFMNATLGELRQDRGNKLQVRLDAVEARLKDAEAMLRVAKRNADEPPLAPVGVAAVIASAAAAATAAAPKEKKRKEPPNEAKEEASKAKASEPSAPKPAKKGPERPSRDVLEEAAKAAQVEAPAAVPVPKAKRGPERPPPAVLAKAGPPGEEEEPEEVDEAAANLAALAAEMLKAQAANAPARPRRPTGPRVQIDPDKAGLQGIKRPAEAEAMPPPELALKQQRKVYGVARPPPGPIVSRDASEADSGELQEAEG